MDDDNTTLPSLVGGDVNSAESSVSHSFYSNSLFSMIRHEDISDDDLLQRLSMKKSSHRDSSSASAMVTDELMMASHRHKVQRLYDDMMADASACSDEEDGEILDLCAMAKHHETSVDVTSDAGAFSSQLPIPIQKRIDPPEENDVESGTTTLPRINTSNPRNRYRRMNTDGNPQMYAQNGTCVDSKQQYIRRYTDPCCTDANERDKRKPDPIETGSTRSTCNIKSAYSDEDSVLELARRMGNSCGIEDTPSIEGPTDNYYWDNRKHSSGISDGGSSCKIRSRSRRSARSRNRSRSRHSIRSKKKHWYDDDGYDDGERQQTSGDSRGSKMKGLFNLIAGKTNRKRGKHRHNRDRRRSRSMSSSRCSRRNSNRGRSSSCSLSSNYSRQSSRKAVNSSYSSSSRRKPHKRKNASMLSVAEAVAYLNQKELMTKSPSLSSLRSHASRKSSASKLSSISRDSRRSSFSSNSNGGKNTTVSKVVGAASGLKKKIRRRRDDGK